MNRFSPRHGRGALGSFLVADGRPVQAQEADSGESEGGGVPLTREQEPVVGAPRDAKALTLAGPGTGKTHTLLARLACLLDAPAEEPRAILVLSFTRAVVAEIHKRLGETGISDLMYLRPLTFDSFATRLLASGSSAEDAGDWRSESYDDRIRSATSSLRSDAATRDWLVERFDHVVVDEIQDLVGPRAEMVLEVLSTIGAFDLFGDPAQGIYGWQLQEDRDPSSDQFLEDVKKRFGAELTEFELRENHRMSDEQALRVSAARPGLLDLDEAAAVWPEISGHLNELTTVGTIESFGPVLRSLKRRTAILCRTNVEALTISDRLHALGVSHTLRRSSAERAVPDWVAKVCRGRRSSLRRDSFMETYEESGDCRLDAEEAWELVSSVGEEDRRVSIEALADAIRREGLPDELYAHGAGDLVLSTVHRAKGLEFDDVVVVEPEPWRIDRGDRGEESRVLFVAMTRARLNLFQMDPVVTAGWTTDPRIGRWVRSWPKQPWMTHGVEVRGEDLDSMRPAGTWVFEAAAPDLQDYMAAEMSAGDEVRLELDTGWREDERMGRYVMFHGDTRVGVTGERFSDLLALRLAGHDKQPRKWPEEIVGLRFEGLDTVAGLAGAGQQAGLGSNGLWLRPRPSGLGEIVWENQR